MGAKKIITIRAICVAALLLATAATAQNATDTSETPSFKRALDMLVNGDAQGAYDSLAGSSVLEQDLLGWMQLRDTDTDFTFTSYTRFLERHPDWPGNDRIRANAERVIDETIPDADVLAFFDGANVETGQGAVAYANALITDGRKNEADAMLVDQWLTSAFTTSSHQAIVTAFPEVVASHHFARADMLLWRWRTSDAANVVSLLDEGQQALIRARIANINSYGDIQARENLIPDRLQDNAGLHYDRFSRLADQGDFTEASIILTTQSTSTERLGIPWRWGSWRRILARWHMREGNIAVAYRFAAQHFIQPDEDNYSDLEWLAGYIALTYMQDYDAAIAHFQRFDASVSSPISKGRAGYWLGRAHEVSGNVDAAIDGFQMSAKHQTSFYGLLSAEKLGLTLNPDILGGENFGDWRSSPILNSEFVRAGLALLDADERGLAVLFFRDAAVAMSRQEIGQLGALFMDLGEPFYTILIAKVAVRGDLLVQDAYFPVHSMAHLDLPVEPALALAIARQESEFRTDAGSRVGALGLMQLMPTTAQEVAEWLDFPYSRGRLTTDWEYNAILGSEYLAYLIRQFGDSPVMVAAGYNAGPSRPKSWMTERGDPRLNVLNPDPVDVIDWIEHIPFRETRNYVMRVTEGILVYRARLSGNIAPVNFTDILIGSAPLIRPVARTAHSIDAVQDPVLEAIPTPLRPPLRLEELIAPAQPTGPQLTRPVARASN